MLTPEQTEHIKKQLIEHIEKGFPKDKHEFAKKQIEGMNSEQLEEFLKRNKLMQAPQTSQPAQKSQGCVFCSIVSGEISSYKINENRGALAVLEINPVSKGHTIIIPKEHLSSLDKVPQLVFSLAKSVARRLKTKLKPKNTEISSLNLFGHEIVNVIPLYKDENTVEKHPAKREELAELQKILIKTKKSTKKAKKIKTNSKKPEKKIWLPKRIP
jgi:diadenosine tetraphosphate (Ap4A) HIT family hydrolase